MPKLPRARGPQGQSTLWRTGPSNGSQGPAPSKGRISSKAMREVALSTSTVSRGSEGPTGLGVEGAGAHPALGPKVPPERPPERPQCFTPPVRPHASHLQGGLRASSFGTHGRGPSLYLHCPGPHRAQSPWGRSTHCSISETLPGEACAAGSVVTGPSRTSFRCHPRISAPGSMGVGDAGGSGGFSI